MSGRSTLSMPLRRRPPPTRAHSFTQSSANPSLSAGSNVSTTLLRFENPPITEYDAAVGLSKDAWSAEFYAQNLTNSNKSTYTSTNQFVLQEAIVRPGPRGQDRIQVLSVGDTDWGRQAGSGLPDRALVRAPHDVPDLHDQHRRSLCVVDGARAHPDGAAPERQGRRLFDRRTARVVLRDSRDSDLVARGSINRRNILGICVLIWSGFTALCGLSRTYLEFSVRTDRRRVQGRPEVRQHPTPCWQIISPPSGGPMAFTSSRSGAPLGAWLGADIAGAVANTYGWRAAFLALGVPGVVIGLLVLLTIREPARGRLDGGVVQQRASLTESLRFLWRQRAAFHVIMGSGVCSLWGWGLIWWTPTYLMRTYGLNVGEAGAVTGNIHLIAGVLASLGTAWLFARPACLTHAASAGSWRRGVPGDDSLLHRLLDAFSSGRSRDVLAVHPRDLFLYRTLHGAGDESGRLPHALCFYGLVGTLRQRLQSDCGPSTGGAS